MSDKPSFASRWSRQKQLSKEESVVDEVEEEAAPVEPEKTDEEVLAEFNLKDPDDMEAGDDFSAFMNSAIPQRLRNRALRKLWLSNPALANLDELVEYGEDFNKSGELAENFATAYKVGKGFIEDLVEDEDQTEKLSEPESENDESESDEKSNPKTKAEAKVDQNERNNSVRKPEGIRAVTPLPAEKITSASSEIGETPPKPRKKRMNFRF